MIIVRHQFGVLLIHRCCRRIQWMMLAIGACSAMFACARLLQEMPCCARHNECPSLAEMRSLHESASVVMSMGIENCERVSQSVACKILFIYFFWKKKKGERKKDLIYFHFFLIGFSFEHQTTEIYASYNIVPSRV